MGQSVHSTGFRLKRFKNWRSQACFLDKYEYFINNVLSKRVEDYLFLYFNYEVYFKLKDYLNKIQDEESLKYYFFKEVYRRVFFFLKKKKIKNIMYRSISSVGWEKKCKYSFPNFLYSHSFIKKKGEVKEINVVLYSNFRRIKPTPLDWKAYISRLPLVKSELEEDVINYSKFKSNDLKFFKKMDFFSSISEKGKRRYFDGIKVKRFSFTKRVQMVSNLLISFLSDFYGKKKKLRIKTRFYSLKKKILNHFKLKNTNKVSKAELLSKFKLLKENKLFFNSKNFLNKLEKCNYNFFFRPKSRKNILKYLRQKFPLQEKRVSKLIISRWKFLFERILVTRFSRLFFTNREKFVVKIRFIQGVWINPFFCSKYLIYLLKRKKGRFPKIATRLMRRIRYYGGLKHRLFGMFVSGSGRFTKRQRASYIKTQRGVVPFGTIVAPMTFSEARVPLKYGSVNVKVWVCHVIKKNV